MVTFPLPFPILLERLVRRTCRVGWRSFFFFGESFCAGLEYGKGQEEYDDIVSNPGGNTEGVLARRDTFLPVLEGRLWPFWCPSDGAIRGQRGVADGEIKATLTPSRPLEQRIRVGEPELTLISSRSSLCLPLPLVLCDV
jgi:hypothetical protein